MDKAAPALELRDIHLPTDPSIWPLAPGWWVLIVIVAIAAYYLYQKWSQRRRLKQLNQLMQLELLAIRKDYQQHNNKQRLASDISELLKRFVRHVLKDSNATALTGKDWIHYLNSRVGSDVFGSFQQELTQAQYMKQADFDVPSLMAIVKNYFPAAIKFVKQYNHGKLTSARSGQHA
jgi:type II secretory pathway pseudopilin PulG